MTRQKIEGFLYREARLLDERRFEEWIGLFTENGYYWVPAYPDQEDPYQAVSIYFDDREMMKTRLSRLDHPKIHAQSPASRTCHFLSNIEIDWDYGDPAEVLVHSTLMMLEYRLDKQTSYGGRCRHLLRADGDTFKLAWKRVDLINCDSVLQPMAVPF